MKTTYLFSKIYNKEEYKFFLNTPEYEGEKGLCGIEIKPYVSVETPENAFGYTDTVLMDTNTKTVYTLHRYLQPWIKKKIGERMLEIEDAFWKNVYKQKGVEYEL